MAGSSTTPTTRVTTTVSWTPLGTAQGLVLLCIKSAPVVLSLTHLEPPEVLVGPPRLGQIHTRPRQLTRVLLTHSPVQTQGEKRREATSKREGKQVAGYL